MKTYTKLLSIVFILALWSCGEGPVGPVGPQGPAGPSGAQGAPGESGFIIQYEDISFTGPDYEFIDDYKGFEVLDTDVVLVYFLWDEENVIWRQIPQTIFHPEGLLIYNFDYQVEDFRVFLSADFDLDLLTAVDTDDWTFRVVVAPGDIVNSGGRQDFGDYNKVKELLGLPELEIRNSKGLLRRD
ncbi:MAG: collagen-like protein [Bacteroidota bacterium]